VGRLALLAAGLVLVTAACGPAHNQSEGNTLVNQGLSYQRSNQLSLAQAAYREALRQDPGNKFALYNLGVLERDAGQTEAAIANFENALRTDPNFVPALFALAELRTATAPQEAQSLYERAVKAAPKQASPHLGLGLLLRKMGQTAKGDAEVATALRLDPGLIDKLPAEVRSQFTATTRP
jgi:tetratricopeptide (TPR) repeat protein